MMLGVPQIISIAIILLVALRKVRLRHSNHLKLPPSPPGIPLLGNLLQVPRKFIAQTPHRPRQRLVLIGDIKVAKELLEKHAAKHSSRPIIYYIRYHLDPTESNWSHSAEGPTVSLGRRLSTGIMSSVRAGKTEPLQEFEALLNVQKLLDDGGKDWFHYAKRFSASTALAAAYGLHCPTGHEPALQKVRKAIDELVVLFNPTASIVNAFPLLDLIPGPMPWRARAREFHEQETAIYKELLDHALTGRGSGMNTWAAAFAREDKPGGDQGRLLKTFSGAAIETIAVSVQTFVLACIRHPEWVTTAQEQIDAVVGPDRLPSFKDRPLLPYVEAIVRETLRWRPAARSGMPHQSVADDTIEYRGQTYFLPKGSIIFAVTWAIEHDHSRFEDHDRFMPERFLDAEGNLKPNYETSAFGFGRRGQLLFAAINTTSLLIYEPLTLDPKTGQPFQYDDSDAAFNGDLTNALLPFPAVFEPRSLQKAEVARREWAGCEKNLEALLPAPKEG
ncbi:hypothetical protein C0992_009501 [Termitomyces sp. T32_za158]|nr:hypothetical protein C0992_009501 [Termitomyces sp. T32_za158]